MASASFVLYVWILSSHKWLLVSTWPVNPKSPWEIPQHFCNSHQGNWAPGTGQNLISAPILYFQSRVIFMT